MNRKVLIAAAVIIVLVILYFFVRPKKKVGPKRIVRPGPSPQQKQAEKLLQQSNGTFDAPAQKALQITDNPAQKVRTLYYNLMEGDVGAFTERWGPERAAEVMNEVVTNMMQAAIDGNDVVADAENILAQEDPELQRTILNSINNNRAEKPSKLEEKAKKIKSDNQNVHDSIVSHQMRQSLDKIEGKVEPSVKSKLDLINVPKKIPTWKELTNEIEARIAMFPPERVAAIRSTLKAAIENTYPVYDRQENEILCSVWARAQDMRNKPNAENIKAAIIDSLHDASKEGTVCPTGRAARYVESLTLLDFSDEIGGSVTLDMQKAEIFREVAKVRDDLLNKAPEDVRKSYNEGTIADDAPLIIQIKERVKEIVNTTLKADVISEATREKVIEECNAGI